MRKGEYTGENLVFEIVWKANCKLSADMGLQAVEGKVTRILNVLEKGHKRHQLVHQHQKCRQSPQDAS